TALAGAEAADRVVGDDPRQRCGAAGGGGPCEVEQASLRHAAHRRRQILIADLADEAMDAGCRHALQIPRMSLATIKGRALASVVFSRQNLCVMRQTCWRRARGCFLLWENTLWHAVMLIALAQTIGTAGDVGANLALLEDLALRAAGQGAALLVLPEL